jgi:hypothetical protein
MKTLGAWAALALLGLAALIAFILATLLGAVGFLLLAIVDLVLRPFADVYQAALAARRRA